jgi:hypothetical protein
VDVRDVSRSTGWADFRAMGNSEHGFQYRHEAGFVLNSKSLPFRRLINNSGRATRVRW